MGGVIPDAAEPVLHKALMQIAASQGVAVALETWNGFWPGGPDKDQAALEELLKVPRGSLSQFYLKPLPDNGGSVPAPVGGGQRIKMVGLPYYWDNYDGATLYQAVVQTGNDGAIYELAGHGWKQDGANNAKMFQHMRSQIQKLGSHVAAARQTGKKLDLVWWNTNIDKPLQLTVDQHLELFNFFVGLYGTDNILMLDFSERDSDTLMSVVNGVGQVIRDRWPDAQTIAYGGAGLPPWAAYIESHMQHVGSIPSIRAPYSYGVTDSRDILEEMMTDGVFGTNPRHDKCVAAVRAPWNAGCSIGLYHFMKYIDYELWAKVGAL